MTGRGVQLNVLCVVAGVVVRNCIRLLGGQTNAVVTVHCTRVSWVAHQYIYRWQLQLQGPHNICSKPGSTPLHLGTDNSLVTRRGRMQLSQGHRYTVLAGCCHQCVRVVANTLLWCPSGQPGPSAASNASSWCVFRCCTVTEAHTAPATPDDAL